jgi:hypothetical protein
MEQLVEWKLAGETEVQKVNYQNAMFSPTNPIRPDLGSNPGRRLGKPATNRLGYGTASVGFQIIYNGVPSD